MELRNAVLRSLGDSRAQRRLAALVQNLAGAHAHRDGASAMMPPWIALHLELVLFTGAAEIAGGLGLLIPRLRRLAGLMLAIYFVAVFPANIHNALNGLAVEGLPQAGWYYWARLLFQPLAVWWALFSAQLIRWPFIGGRKPRGAVMIALHRPASFAVPALALAAIAARSASS
jgi:uncharacterized membrane protein